MNDRPKTLLVCVNRRFGAAEASCGGRGSEALAEAVERGVAERRIDVAVERICCLGKCQFGPNMRLAPGGAFFMGLTPETIADVLDTLVDECGTKADTDEPPLHLLGS